MSCETISCPHTSEGCGWCGAAPNQACQQPDLRSTPGARRAFEIPTVPEPIVFGYETLCSGCSSPDYCRKNPPRDDDPSSCLNFLPEPPGLAEYKAEIENPFNGDETVSFGDAKEDLTMIDPQFLREVSKVLAMGAEKYERDNWRKGTKYQRRMASALRHIMTWIDGEDLDDESGLPHLAHAVTNLMFVMNWQRRGVGTDDRFKP